MRKLATRLGVQAGALYWHFAGKQSLLDAMADRFPEDFAADLPAGSWDEQLAATGGVALPGLAEPPWSSP